MVEGHLCDPKFAPHSRTWAKPVGVVTLRWEWAIALGPFVQCLFSVLRDVEVGTCWVYVIVRILFAGAVQQDYTDVSIWVGFLYSDVVIFETFGSHLCFY